MSTIENFLTLEQENEIVLAIRQAERNTSGEIRVHIEATTNLVHFDRAVEVFRSLKMYNTQKRNAILIYIAVQDHKFVIYGDKGINEVVPDNFWEKTKDILLKHFKKGAFKQGIIEGVLQVGTKLKAHFPYENTNVNELPNQVSKG